MGSLRARWLGLRVSALLDSGEIAGAQENAAEHRFGEFSGIGVLQRRMVGREQQGIEKFPRAVAGEGTSRAIGAVGTGGEAEEQDFCVRVTEAGDGLGPVVPVLPHAFLDPANLLAIYGEPGTAGAGDDALVQF